MQTCLFLTFLKKQENIKNIHMMGCCISFCSKVSYNCKVLPEAKFDRLGEKLLVVVDIVVASSLQLNPFFKIKFAYKLATTCQG